MPRGFSRFPGGGPGKNQKKAKILKNALFLGPKWVDVMKVPSPEGCAGVSGQNPTKIDFFAYKKQEKRDF